MPCKAPITRQGPDYYTRHRLVDKALIAIQGPEYYIQAQTTTQGSDLILYKARTTPQAKESYIRGPNSGPKTGPWAGARAWGPDNIRKNRLGGMQVRQQTAAGRI